MASSGPRKIERNPVKHKLHHGLPAVGSWMGLSSVMSAELLAGVGWDWVVVDAQHSPIDLETMTNCFRAIQLAGSIPMARVPWNDTVWIQRTLDAGALGLVVPMINSAADAEQAVANCKYGGTGIRSYTSGRITGYLDGDTVAWANDNIVVIGMTETVAGVENAEAILSVEGLDGCFIGPRDLGISMGVPANETGPGTAHEQAILSVLAAGKKVGAAVGKHCADAEEVNQRIAQGFQFLALASDARFMIKAAKEELAKVRG